MSEKPRYIVHPESYSGHCCFEATVLDTSQEEHDDMVVCECFDPENAKRIAALLNGEKSNA